MSHKRVHEDSTETYRESHQLKANERMSQSQVPYT